MNHCYAPIQRLSQLLHQTTQLFSRQNLLQIHAQLITTGHHSHPSTLLSLLQLYLSNPSTLPHATAIFDQIQEPNSSKWRLMIRRLASDSQPTKAIALFREMLSVSNPTSPFDDSFTYASLIKCCSKLEALREGKSIHCHVLRNGLDYNVHILNSLVSFYLNSANFVGYACTLFDRMPERTVVTVNCMISGYVKNGVFNTGLGLFVRVLSGCFGSSVKPNYVTLLVLISGCAEFRGLISVGNLLHSYCCKVGLDSGNEVYNALIDMYTKFGNVDDAERVFNEAHKRDLISWNTMMVGCAKNNDGSKTFALFREMRFRNLDFDRVSFISLILAVTSSRDLDMGEAVHGYVKRIGIDTDASVQTALINMYSKCGSIEFARKVFDGQQNGNIASWNSMIHGYVGNGANIEALRLFDEINSRKLKADEVTMLGLISACRNSGDLHHGIHIHSYIKSSDHLSGSTILCNALIDMYAKCGSMSKARALFAKMPRRDVISWTSIIVGSAVNGEGEEALVAFRQMCAEKIEPNSVTFIGVLSACDHCGLIDDGQNLFDIMCKLYHIEPRIEHCGCMVDMHARAGMLEEAYRFVKTMPIQPNAVVWRMLIHASKIHGNFDMGLSLVSGLTELQTLHGPENHIISCNIFAQAGLWNDVLNQRRLMVAKKVTKAAARSSVSLLTD